MDHISKLLVWIVLVLVSNVVQALNVSSLSSQVNDGGSVLAPYSVDWRRRGALTGVKNSNDACPTPPLAQNRSGSSWAYATASAVESITKICRGVLRELSAKQLLDCDTNNYKCAYGYTYDAFYYVKTNGLKTASEYSRNKVCGIGATKIDGYSQLPAEGSNPTAKITTMMNLVAKYPVTAQIDGSSEEFKKYRGGIYTGPCLNEGADLSVLIVGYGTENRKDYWIIQNAWGREWGESGYMRLEKGYKEFGGKCGIRNSVAYPILNPRGPQNM